MRNGHWLGAVALLLAATSLDIRAQTPRSRQGDLKVGDAAPDFAVEDVQGKRVVKLSELRGKPVVLIFGSCT
jgi:cytochrome oxidase Cu insertion factor (SCO1/SenC/PrrC family)